MSEDPITSTPPPSDERPQNELLKLFDEEERSYYKRLKDMVLGFSKPKDSIEFKKALIELQRLWAPIIAISLPIIVVIVMGMVKIGGADAKVQVETQIVEAVETPKLEEPEKPPETPPELEDTPPVEVDVTVDIDAPPTTSSEQSPQPSPMDAVALTPSPVIMKNVMGSRTPGLKGAAIGRYGAGATEKYIQGFLRYLKSEQKPNGMWASGMAGSTGETALILLTFLAHGETPSSPEFGSTVEKAIRALLNDQIKTEAECGHKDAPDTGGNHAWRRDHVGYFKSRDTCNYSHLVAVYALSEAYAMTRIPDIKDAVELALPHIYNGQNANGGWYYNMDSRCPITDSSYASWAVQAMKAAKIAGFHDRKLIDSLKKSARGIRTTQSPDGSFGYLDTMPGKNNYHGLTSAGVLLLQMLDESDTDGCKKAIAYMDSWEPTFIKNFKATNSSAMPMSGNSPQYYCYYLAQVRFNLGDNNPAWKRWNEQQKRLYTAASIVIPAEKSGYVDQEGKPQYISFWGTTKMKSKYKGENAPISDMDRLTQDRATRDGRRNGIPVKDLMINDSASIDWYNGRNLAGCFTALQLMVYYRNSPLAKGALTRIEAEAEVKIDEGSTEVTVQGIDDL
ncbi:MAG: hypothetical protein RR268_03750 [Kiritimatiellia bacterium]